MTIVNDPSWWLVIGALVGWVGLCGLASHIIVGRVMHPSERKTAPSPTKGDGA